MGNISMVEIPVAVYTDIVKSATKVAILTDMIQKGLVQVDDTAKMLLEIED